MSHGRVIPHDAVPNPTATGDRCTFSIYNGGGGGEGSKEFGEDSGGAGMAAYFAEARKLSRNDLPLAKLSKKESPRATPRKASPASSEVSWWACGRGSGS